MKVLHISAECYPAAKAGGMGDVVGSLPKYLNTAASKTGVVIPKYQTSWIENHDYTTVFKGNLHIHNYYVPFTVEKAEDESLGFELFLVNMPGRFDRAGIYTDRNGKGFDDNVERYLAFQQAILHWLSKSNEKPEMLHCHDHHTGLIPFMVKHCPDFEVLKGVPTVFTIHNAEYQGAFGWENLYLLPWFERDARSLLDWNNSINPLAVAIKCAWRITTVSHSYLEELKVRSNGLEWLIAQEAHKAVGILNGIDEYVWDPKQDFFLKYPLNGVFEEYKLLNKQNIVNAFNLDSSLPLITFIGRLVREKGADLLPDLIAKVMNSELKVSIMILGTGEERLMNTLWQMKRFYNERFDVSLEYNESLAHQLYAGSDFLFIPSRVEPCGLNQMYAMKYGTIPIVRSIGGLRDTVYDIEEQPGTGRGICFNHFNLEDSFQAIQRAVALFNDKKAFDDLRQRITTLDFSWKRASRQYVELYGKLKQIREKV